MKVFYRMIQSSHQKGIAMIELIFAIVIMGIIMLSVPQIVSSATKSTYIGMQQEAINMAATQLSEMMTFAWDENDANMSEKMPVLQTASAFIPNCINATPPGVTSASGRLCRGFVTNASFNATATTAALGADINDFERDDVDDFDDSNLTMTIYGGEGIETQKGNYVDTQVKLRSTISYGDDTPRTTSAAPSAGGYDRNIAFANPFRFIMPNSTNIKLLSITLTSDNSSDEIGQKQISLSAFMCNIGAPRQLKTNN